MNTELTTITNLETIRDLIVLYYKKHNNSDPKRIERFIAENSHKLENKESRCIVLNKEDFSGFIYGYYFSKHQCFEISAFYFIDQGSNRLADSANFINQFAAEVLNSQTNFFRFKLNYEVEKDLLDELSKNGFKAFPRHTMSIDLDKEFPPAELPKGYSFVDYDLKRYFEDNEMVLKSYLENIDSKIFPEVLFKSDEIEAEGEDPYLNPQILYKGKIVASVHGGENLSQPPKVAAWLDNLSVLPAFQGKGLGFLIMQETLCRCSKKNYTRLGLHVTADNHAALKLYKKLGFKIENKFYFFTKHYQG